MKGFGAIRFCCGKIETNQLTKCWLGLKLNLHVSDVFFLWAFLSCHTCLNTVKSN